MIDICPMCGEPAHASESNDLGWCLDCIRTRAIAEIHELEDRAASIRTAQRYYARTMTPAELGTDQLPGIAARIAELRAELAALPEVSS